MFFCFIQVLGGPQKNTWRAVVCSSLLYAIFASLCIYICVFLCVYVCIEASMIVYLFIDLNVNTFAIAYFHCIPVCLFNDAVASISVHILYHLVYKDIITLLEI